jgi:hypothetical protein
VSGRSPLAIFKDSKRGIVFWGPAAIAATATAPNSHTHIHSHRKRKEEEEEEKKKEEKRKKKKRRGVTVGHSPLHGALVYPYVCVYRHKLRFPVPNARTYP